jgi:hypothetical protein
MFFLLYFQAQGTTKLRIENETKWNETKNEEMKRNETKRNEMKLADI